MRLARARRTGPLFTAIDRHGNEPRQRGSEPDRQTVRRGGPADDPTDYSAHSLRAGFVTEARARRVPDAVIARHTRHKDLRMLGIYDRSADLFNDPALAGEWW